MNFETLGGRKFILGFLIILCATVMAVTGTITYDQWIELTKWIFFAYAGSNAVKGLGEFVKNVATKGK